jgi:sigma-B regulation protein RsbU (phosphoserine phosphatase)
VIDDFEFEPYTCSLDEGDVFVIFTDGISEAMNDRRELYGVERISKQIGNRAVSVAEMGAELLDDVQRFVGYQPQSDDMCLMCFGRDEA